MGFLPDSNLFVFFNEKLNCLSLFVSGVTKRSPRRSPCARSDRRSSPSRVRTPRTSVTSSPTSSRASRRGRSLSSPYKTTNHPVRCKCCCIVVVVKKANNLSTPVKICGQTHVVTLNAYFDLIFYMFYKGKGPF